MHWERGGKTVFSPGDITYESIKVFILFGLHSPFREGFPSIPKTNENVQTTKLIDKNAILNNFPLEIIVFSD
jgi:hypothetical protein